MAASSDPKVLQGYVSVRPFGGVALPVPIQNLVLRNYCQQIGFLYALPMGEHKYEDCFMQLFATLNGAEKNSDIGFCSAHMLPTNNELMAKLQSIVTAKHLTLHCLFEGAVINTLSGFQEIRRRITLRKYADEVDSHAVELKRILRQESCL